MSNEVAFSGVWHRVSFSYKRMEEKDVIRDRTLFVLSFISYKRMEEQVVIADRTLLAFNCFGVHFLQKNGGKRCHQGQDLVCSKFHFLQKNGGEGCHRGQALVLRFPTKEWRRRMSLWTGPCVMVSYKRMEEKVSCWTGPLDSLRTGDNFSQKGSCC